MLIVTCTIIIREGKVLICQRSSTMNLPLKWEFPGGKVEPGEDDAATIVREIKEELHWANQKPRCYHMDTANAHCCRCS